jgi:hypothetical protein
MQKLSPWIRRNRTPKDDEMAINDFLSSGKKITVLKTDSGAYEEGLKKTKQRLDCGFNPFSKLDSLKVK